MQVVLWLMVGCGTPCGTNYSTRCKVDTPICQDPAVRDRFGDGKWDLEETFARLDQSLADRIDEGGCDHYVIEDCGDGVIALGGTTSGRLFRIEVVDRGRAEWVGTLDEKADEDPCHDPSCVNNELCEFTFVGREEHLQCVERAHARLVANAETCRLGSTCDIDLCMGDILDR